MTLKSWKVSSKLTSSAVSTTENSETKKLKSIFTSAAAHTKDINSISLSPNDKFIATASQDKTGEYETVLRRVLFNVLKTQFEDMRSRATVKKLPKASKIQIKRYYEISAAC